MVILALSLLLAAAEPPAQDEVLAEVNGRALTSRDLAVALASRGVPEKVSAAFRRRAIEELVERELIRQFLESRKTEADPEQLAAVVRAATKQLAGDAKDPQAALAARGLDEARLRSELALPLAWRKQVSRIVTDKRIRDHFEKHRRRLDGTRLRVSQIFLKYEPGESPRQAESTAARLQAIRKDIVAGTTSFADAAMARSQSPTAASGGDVGWIDPRGDLPAAVSDAAYSLESGTVSDIVLSPFGAHLVTVTKTENGDLSLEDARPAILAELSQSLWDETVAAERMRAKIVMRE